MTAAHLILALVAGQRLAELVYGERNARALKRQGAYEVGHRHYPLLVLLHATWLVAMWIQLPRQPVIDGPLIGAFAALQIARYWVIASLGRYWTTRIVTLPDAPLVRRGPYRFLRHPNYVIVVGEIALLPMAFGQVGTAIVFSVLNLALLGWRIRVEEATLATRRGLKPTGVVLPAP